MRKFAGYFAKMKAWQVVIFLFGVFALLGLGWVLTPAEGVTVAGKNLRFASLEKMLQEASEAKVDVDSVLNAVEGRFGVKGDTLAYYRDFFYENPDRIYLPDNDYTYLDPVFKEFARRDPFGEPVIVIDPVGFPQRPHVLAGHRCAESGPNGIQRRGDSRRSFSYNKNIRHISSPFATLCRVSPVRR